MYKEHPSFTTPAPKTKIWRYMDLSKFLYLITTNFLYFPRSDKLGDPYEGSYTKIDLANREAFLKTLVSRGKKFNNPFSETIYKNFRKLVYINSWYQNEYESAAMWSLYALEGKGIAIQSTISRLQECMIKEKHETYIGLVKYVDYENHENDQRNFLNSFTYKRNSFEHEHEVRAVVLQGLQDLNLVVNGKKETPLGLGIKVEINKLIEAIYISPIINDWFSDIVKDICKKYKIAVPIKKSNLRDKPFF